VSLTAADVAEILRLLEESSFDELDLEINGVKLSLRRGGGEEALSRRAAKSAAGAAGATTATTTAGSSAANSSVAQSGGPNSAATHAAPARATAADPNLHDVPSPLLGTFYRSPKPGAPPFVEVGSTVTEDTIVAIIEVMKLMNTVRAGARGTVAEILPSDGSLVEYDQTILRIRKPG
jgi:acetyl-CoA carboxylase biotin carboxyl carrier protein